MEEKRMKAADRRQTEGGDNETNPGGHKYSDNPLKAMKLVLETHH